MEPGWRQEPVFGWVVGAGQDLSQALTTEFGCCPKGAADWLPPRILEGHVLIQPMVPRSIRFRITVSVARRGVNLLIK